MTWKPLKAAVSNRTRLAYMAAVITLVFGLLALILPEWLVLALGLELSIARPWGISEVRATYGALFLALGIAMLWAVAQRPKPFAYAYLRLAALLWLAAAGGRLFSMILDGALLPMNFLALGVELLVGVPTLVASFEAGRRDVTEPNPLSAYR